jgi:hypothetical protein
MLISHTVLAALVQDVPEAAAATAASSSVASASAVAEGLSPGWQITIYCLAVGLASLRTRSSSRSSRTATRR